MMKKNLLRFVTAAICMVLGGVQAAAQEKEAYAALSDDGQTVTFYYDMQKENRGGMWINSSFKGNPYANVTTAVFDASFAGYRPASTAYWFDWCSYLTTISGMEYLNTASVTNMSCMFANCRSLTSLDVSRWNTANVTDMSYMFSGCSSLTSLDLSGWNTANVTDMNEMFSACSVLKSLDASGWNTSNVTEMFQMFWGCSSLTSLDLSGWNTANVKSMTNMFVDCTSLTTIYADEAKWSTAAVIYGDFMFYGCTALVGGNGTTYNTRFLDREYARIDKEGQPGSLTQKLASGIHGVTMNGTTAGDGQWYTLGGQRIGSEQPTKRGVYVVNGRKVMTR